MKLRKRKNAFLKDGRVKLSQITKRFGGISQKILEERIGQNYSKRYQADCGVNRQTSYYHLKNIYIWFTNYWMGGGRTNARNKCRLG